MSIISNIRGFWAAKKRLIIEYLMIAFAATLCGVVLTLWLSNREQRQRINGLVTTVSDLTCATQQQRETIDNLKELRQQDAMVLEQLNAQYQNLTIKDVNFKNLLNKLEQNDEKTNDYLSQPIPADLMCLLNDTCNTDRK